MYDPIFEEILHYPKCFYIYENFDSYIAAIVIQSRGHCDNKQQFLDFLSYFMPGFKKFIDRLRVTPTNDDTDLYNIMKHIKMERVRKNNRLSYNNSKHHKRLQSIVKHQEKFCHLCFEIFYPRPSSSSSSTSSHSSSANNTSDSFPATTAQPQQF